MELEEFFEAYSLPDNIPPEDAGRTQTMAQTLESNPNALLCLMTRPGRIPTLDMFDPGHGFEEVLVRGPIAEELVKYWEEQGVIEEMGKDRWGQLVIMYYATPWSWDALGILKSELAKDSLEESLRIIEAIEDEMGEVGDFDNPSVRPFRRNDFLGQVLDDFKVKHPDCPLEVSDFYSKGSYQWKAFSRDPVWTASLEYQTAPMNKSSLQLWGTIADQDGGTYYRVSYLYNKRTNQLFDTLND